MKAPFESIAVVGQSCVLPGALDPGQLWTAVAKGRDLTSSVPEGRWGLPRHLAIAEPAGRATDRTWCDRGGYVRGFEQVFDPHGFAVPAAEILELDPLFQWVLHTGREALLAAGVDEQAAGRTGVVLGNLSFPSALASRFAESVWLDAGLPLTGRDPRPVDPRNHFMSGLPAHLLAHALGLGGAAFALDAACASSLVAVKLACDRLHDRRADVMLAGAVSCADDLFIHIGFSALEALSPSGRSRPFHRAADGLLPAEGAAFVALRRLDDAIARGDEILAVIRGVGLSNDGRGGGLLAPSVEGQIRALRRAYDVAAWEPADVSLVECHATGTQTGDAAEIHSLGTLYCGLSDVPIGSLKSNLGHLITAAGLAGLLKVLAAIKAGTRPPTLHTEPANPVLDGSPFRLLRQAEPWASEGPRRAAISAFGFGGNNAHLLIEEWRPEPSAGPLGGPSHSSAPVAIVGLAAMAADTAQTGDFARVVFSGESRLRDREHGGPAGQADTIELSLAGLGFPPNDLKQTLPQQLLLLATARDALRTLTTELPRARTAVLTGIRCDAEIARYGLRWRLAGWGESLDPKWVRGARDAVTGGLQAAGVLGTMPNMTANRLNSQLDLGGPSAAISCEELSGIVALDLATRALRTGEIDAALVGAADLCCEPVYEAAARALAGERIPGDAATVLVLKRLDDARRDDDLIFAVVEQIADPAEPAGAGALRLLRADGEPATPVDLAARLGHAHAASGLLHVAAAALACHHRALPAASGSAATPWLSRGPRRAEVTTSAFSGRTATVRLRDDPRGREEGVSSPICPPPGEPPHERLPRIHLYAGADRADLLERLRDDRREAPPRADSAAPARLALVAADEDELAARRQQARHLLTGEADPAAPRRGVYLRDAPLIGASTPGESTAGELAFVFTGAGAAYHGMGRQLLLALPRLLDRLELRMEEVPAAAAWVYRTDREPLTPLRQLWGSSFLCQAHAELTRGVLGLTPTAVLGYSSGESNSLMALGAWNDLDSLYRDTYACGLFTRQLGGDFAAIRRVWRRAGSSGGEWSNYVLSVPVERVREALTGEGRVHLTLINSPDDVVIGGQAEACQRVIAKLGAAACPLGYDLAVHCPEVEEVAEPWLELHRRATREVPGVRFYTHSTLDHYAPTRESAARAILGQAIRTLDFPALVEKAFDDGVRVFLEHGPRGLCSGWIHKILTRRGVPDSDYLAVALDRAGDSSLRHSVETVARLLAAGVDLRWDVFDSRPAAAQGRILSYPAHWPPIRLPTQGTTSTELAPMATTESTPFVPLRGNPLPTLESPQTMAPAPVLPPVLDDFRGTPARAMPPAAPHPAVVPRTAVSPAVTTASVEPPPPAPRSLSRRKEYRRPVPRSAVPRSAVPCSATCPTCRHGSPRCNRASSASRPHSTSNFWRCASAPWTTCCVPTTAFPQPAPRDRPQGAVASPRRSPSARCRPRSMSPRPSGAIRRRTPRSPRRKLDRWRRLPPRRPPPRLHRARRAPTASSPASGYPARSSRSWRRERSPPSSVRSSSARTATPARPACPSRRSCSPTGSPASTASPARWLSAPSGRRPTSPMTPGICTAGTCPAA